MLILILLDQILSIAEVNGTKKGLKNYNTF